MDILVPVWGILKVKGRIQKRRNVSNLSLWLPLRERRIIQDENKLKELSRWINVYEKRKEDVRAYLKINSIQTIKNDYESEDGMKKEEKEKNLNIMPITHS